MSDRKPKGTSGQEWGILNPYGDLWTYEVFETPAEARKHIADFWRDIYGNHDLTKYKIVRVNVRVTAVWPIKEASDV